VRADAAAVLDRARVAEGGGVEAHVVRAAELLDHRLERREIRASVALERDGRADPPAPRRRHEREVRLRAADVPREDHPFRHRAIISSALRAASSKARFGSWRWISPTMQAASSR